MESQDDEEALDEIARKIDRQNMLIREQNEQLLKLRQLMKNVCDE